MLFNTFLSQNWNNKRLSWKSTWSSVTRPLGEWFGPSMGAVSAISPNNKLISLTECQEQRSTLWGVTELLSTSLDVKDAKSQGAGTKSIGKCPSGDELLTIGETARESRKHSFIVLLMTSFQPFNAFGELKKFDYKIIASNRKSTSYVLQLGYYLQYVPQTM